ncbi:MAG: GNAT family N-acetyltransferase, partial [Nocardioidaceae bacterium]|nr:GNAT family N-acetyltransferase [Nocardioidaceae bacterium]
MTHRYWPMFDIRITTPDLELRHLTEADLSSVADILPADAEQDPAATTYDGLDAARNRGAVIHQEYWRARGGWRP